MSKILLCCLILVATLMACEDDSTSPDNNNNNPIDSINSGPGFVSLPVVECYTIGLPYEAEFTFTDPDLFIDQNEEVHITVIEPAGFAVEPAVVKGILDSTDKNIMIRIFSDSLQEPADGFFEFISIVITDKAGLSDTTEYKLTYSKGVLWDCPLLIGNAKQGRKHLYFGFAENATSGDGTDGAATGILDDDFCEQELPPIPQVDLFDTRWIIPTTNGSLRNIFPIPTNGGETLKLKAMIQAGGINGNNEDYYPVTISWDLRLIPSLTDITNPDGHSFLIGDLETMGQLFNYNMQTGVGESLENVIVIQEGNIITVQILDDSISGLVIMVE